MFRHLILVYVACRPVVVLSVRAQCAKENRQQDFSAENSRACYATSQCFELLHILCYYTLRMGGAGGGGKRRNGHRKKEYV